MRFTPQRLASFPHLHWENSGFGEAHRDEEGPPGRNPRSGGQWAGLPARFRTCYATACPRGPACEGSCSRSPPPAVSRSQPLRAPCPCPLLVPLPVHEARRLTRVKRARLSGRALLTEPPCCHARPDGVLTLSSSGPTAKEQGTRSSEHDLRGRWGQDDRGDATERFKGGLGGLLGYYIQHVLG